MLYVLAGPDDYSRTQALQEIKRSTGDAAGLSLSVTVFEGPKVSVEELSHAVETAPFFSEKRLVIVHGLIEYLDSPSRTGGRGPRSQKDAAPFAACLAAIPESTIVVLVENEMPSPSRKDGLLKGLAGKFDLKTFPLLKDTRLKAWVQKRVADLGGSISPAAVEALNQLVGSNLWTMASEIDKLLLYAKGRHIEEEDVRALVPLTQDVSVFSLIDAIVEFKAEQAARTLQLLLGQGAAPAYLLFMLDRQFRMIVLAKSMKAHGQSDWAIQSRLGVTNDYAFKRTMEQAARYSLPRLRQVYRALLQTDLAMKTGQFDGELAISLLVADLCHRDAVPAAAGGKHGRG